MPTLEELLDTAKTYEKSSIISKTTSPSGLSVEGYIPTYSTTERLMLDINSSYDRGLVKKSPANQTRTFGCALCYLIEYGGSARIAFSKYKEEFVYPETHIGGDQKTVYMYSKAENNDIPKVLVAFKAHMPMFDLVYRVNFFSRLCLMAESVGIIHIPGTQAEFNIKHAHVYVTRKNSGIINIIKTQNVEKNKPKIIEIKNVVKIMTFRSESSDKLYGLVVPYIRWIGNNINFYESPNHHVSLSFFWHDQTYFVVVYVGRINTKITAENVTMDLTYNTGAVNIAESVEHLDTREKVEKFLDLLDEVYKNSYVLVDYNRNPVIYTVPSNSEILKVISDLNYEGIYRMSRDQGLESFTTFISSDNGQLFLNPILYDKNDIVFYLLSRLISSGMDIIKGPYVGWLIAFGWFKLAFYKVEAHTFIRGVVFNELVEDGVKNLLSSTRDPKNIDKQTRSIMDWVEIIEKINKKSTQGFIFLSQIKNVANFKIVIKAIQGSNNIYTLEPPTSDYGAFPGPEYPFAKHKGTKLLPPTNQTVYEWGLNTDLDNKMVGYEVNIGLKATNHLRPFIPNFMVTYGGFHCPSYVTGMMLPPHKRPPQTMCTGGTEEPFVIAEYFPGITMDDYVKIGHVTAQNITRLMIQIFSAIQIAKEKVGFHHYDMNVGNIMISEENVPKSEKSVMMPIFRYKFRSKDVIKITAERVCMFIDFGRSYSTVTAREWMDLIKENYAYLPTYETDIPDIWAFCFTLLWIILIYKYDLIAVDNSLSRFYFYFFQAYKNVVIGDIFQHLQDNVIAFLRSKNIGDRMDFVSTNIITWIKSELHYESGHLIYDRLTSDSVQPIGYDGIFYALDKYIDVAKFLNVLLDETFNIEYSDIYNWGNFSEHEMGKHVSEMTRRDIESRKKSHEKSKKLFRKLEQHITYGITPMEIEPQLFPPASLKPRLSPTSIGIAGLSIPEDERQRRLRQEIFGAT
jgi:hypothetical protein